MAQLLSLPDENLEAILYLTDFLVLMRFRRVCKRLLEIVDRSIPLKYLIELGVSGYEENPRFKGTPTEKLRLLEDRDRYWREMKWNGVDSHAIPSKLTPDARKARGVILWRVPDRPNFGGLDQDPVTSQPRHYQIIQHRLRGGDRQLPMKYISLPGDLILGAFDPGQDLIVAIGNNGDGMDQTSTVNFGHLSSRFEPHPEAAVPSVTLPRLTFALPLVKIADNLIAVFSGNILESRKFLEIFDWKKGIHFTRRQLKNKFSISNKVVLIPPDLYVIVGSCHFENGKEDAVLEVRNLDHRLLALYCLPPMVGKLECEFSEFILTQEVQSKLGPDTCAPLQSSLLSHLIPAVLVLTITAYNSDARAMEWYRGSLTMVILLSRLLKGLDRVSSGAVAPIPWESWGPQNTRCFDFEEYHPSVEGFRVLLHPDDKFDGNTLAAVFDFNPLSIARDISRGKTEGIINEATVIRKNPLFLDDIRTELPYRYSRLVMGSDPPLRSLFAQQSEINDIVVAFQGNTVGDKLHTLLM